MERDVEDGSGVFHQAPAALPACVAVKVVRESGRVVGDDALAGTRGSRQQPAYVLVEVAADPVDKRRSPIIDIRMSALVPRKLTDRLHGARVSTAVRDPPKRDAVSGTDCCCA